MQLIGLQIIKINLIKDNKYIIFNIFWMYVFDYYKNMNKSIDNLIFDML